VLSEVLPVLFGGRGRGVRHAVAQVFGGFLLGASFVVGEQAACLVLNYARGWHDRRQPFYGKPPYPWFPH
jgi:hypothetical protein